MPLPSLNGRKMNKSVQEIEREIELIKKNIISNTYHKDNNRQLQFYFVSNQNKLYFNTFKFLIQVIFQDAFYGLPGFITKIVPTIKVLELLEQTSKSKTEAYIALVKTAILLVYKLLEITSDVIIYNSIGNYLNNINIQI